jgi:methyl-galactoside transport system substrate-binding protein
MSFVLKQIDKDDKAAQDFQLLLNDSQNDQSKQNDQIDVLLAKGVKALAINLVDPACMKIAWCSSTVTACPI